MLYFSVTHSQGNNFESGCKLECYTWYVLTTIGFFFFALQVGRKTDYSIPWFPFWDHHCLFQRFAVILLPVGFLFVFAFHLTVLEPRPQSDLPVATEGKQDEGTQSIPDPLLIYNELLIMWDGSLLVSGQDSRSSCPFPIAGLVLLPCVLKQGTRRSQCLFPPRCINVAVNCQGYCGQTATDKQHCCLSIAVWPQYIQGY